ncbi:Dabb family protein [Marinicrinis sediminis]|uniref:Dabb family protein n=1 Tax=Marinicrinis sediminis TaxID=1652465 RepID=A0ABW5RAI5_9BACL
MITHVVMFKLKNPDETMEQTREVLAGMAGKIPQLREIEVGVDVLRSDRSYDLVLITKFDSLEDLKAYQVHPVHQDVIAYINTVKEVSIAVDYAS